MNFMVNGITVFDQGRTERCKVYLLTSPYRLERGAFYGAIFGGRFPRFSGPVVPEGHQTRPYHEKLIEYGVKGYDWESCWNDYRFMCIFNLYFPPLFYHKKFGLNVMCDHLERSMAAYYDLECRELLE
jgi:hypothetical protein